MTPIGYIAVAHGYGRFPASKAKYGTKFVWCAATKLDSPSHEQEETENRRGSTALPESEKYDLLMKVCLMVRGECSTVTWQKKNTVRA
jgi:hypothetical protein